MRRLLLCDVTLVAVDYQIMNAGGGGGGVIFTLQ